MSPESAGVLSAPGQELLELLSGEDLTPDRALRLGTDLRARYPADLVAAALTQQTLRMAARAKFGLADRMLFTRAGLEQASSDLTARHSATRLSGLARVADLCCGIGGNLMALAEAAGPAGEVLAVDADLETLRYAMFNASVHGVADRVLPLCDDVRDLDLSAGGSAVAVYIDPARRASGRRLRAGDSQPPLEWCLDLADQVPSVCIKAAPGLPRELAPRGWELEFVATGRQLKEALLWSPALAACARRATILPGGHCLTAVAGPPVEIKAPGAYLLDPNPAVTRAGLVEDLARVVGGWKIDPMIAFLAIDEEVVTPFARTLRVLESMPWHERTVARKLRELGIGTADIRRRGLAGDVAQIHRRLGLEGDASATIVITRREGRPWSLICVPVTGSDHASP
jgi:SAM-dependent methyltransferase